MTEFAKLSGLVDQEITVESVLGYQFKLWDKATSRMLVSDDFKPGYRKLYQVITDKGQLDMGTGQLGTLLETVSHAGKSSIIGVTYKIKSNGKTGMDIRYFFNPMKMKTETPETNEYPEDYNG